MASDFYVSGHGTIYILVPVSEAAQAWTDEYIDPDAQTWGAGIVVEHRYIEDIVAGAEAAGLTVSGLSFFRPME